MRPQSISMKYGSQSGVTCSSTFSRLFMSRTCNRDFQQPPDAHTTIWSDTGPLPAKPGFPCSHASHQANVVQAVRGTHIIPLFMYMYCRQNPWSAKQAV
jgi:hypothetical protein